MTQLTWKRSSFVLAWLRNLVVLLASIFLLNCPCWAQVSAVTQDQAPPIPGAGHDYINLLDETVNPSSGSVSIRIRVPMPAGRSLTLPFAFAYDSNAANHFVSRRGHGEPLMLGVRNKP
jgi:hypothetical protein